MTNNFLKILFYLLLMIILQNCGYEPLLTEKYQKFSINSFEISGNKKLGQMLSNRFIKFKDAQNNLICILKLDKNRVKSNKTQAGKVLEYTLNVSVALEAVSMSSGDKILIKGYSEKQSFKASTLYSDTLSREEKIITNLIKLIADQITNDLNLIYRGK